MDRSEVSRPNDTPNSAPEIHITLKGLLRYLRQYGRELQVMPPEQRTWLFRQRLELMTYAWWRDVRGRPIRMPVCAASTGGHSRVTKQVPGIFVPWFGRRLWLLVPVILEQEPVEPQGLEAPTGV